MTNILDKFRMDGQAAVVTGGAGLLGKQFSRTLAEAGAGVVVADLNAEAAEAVAASIRKDGYKAIGVGVNVVDKKSVNALVVTTIKEYGRLDALVCSAAMDPKFDPEHAGENRN